MLEERDAAAGDVQVRNVWSVVYVDAMVLRDRDTDADSRVESTSAGDERLYVLHDANFNITAVTDHTGVVQERYLYDPYGERTVIDANWAADSDGISDVGFVHGHQGGRHDLAAGLVHFRFRDLDTSLGRWTRQDPLGYVDGLNTYTYTRENPLTGLDHSGTKTQKPWYTWVLSPIKRYEAWEQDRQYCNWAQGRCQILLGSANPSQSDLDFCAQVADTCGFEQIADLVEAIIRSTPGTTFSPRPPTPKDIIVRPVKEAVKAAFKDE